MGKGKREGAFIARVGVGSASGPNSAVWRFWSNAGKSDVYAGVRELTGDFKVSLHGTGNCNAGLTTAFASTEAAAVAQLGGSRHQSQWSRQTHLGSRIVTPLQIAIPASELAIWRTGPIRDSRLLWIPGPATARSIIISCVFSGQRLSGDEWPGRTNGTQLVGTKLLPNGEKFWLVWQDCPTSDEERSIIQAGAALRSQPGMIRFSRPEPHPGPRSLLFKDFVDDGLLVVVDARAT